MPVEDLSSTLGRGKCVKHADVTSIHREGGCWWQVHRGEELSHRAGIAGIELPRPNWQLKLQLPERPTHHWSLTTSPPGPFTGLQLSNVA